VSTSSEGSFSKPKTSLLRYLRWRDLIAVLLGLALGWGINHGYSFHEPSDYQKWQTRQELHPLQRTTVDGKRQSAPPPCFFIVPKGAKNQPVATGSVGDCLRLVPDGRNLDLFEIALLGGFTHIKTDLYVHDDVMPLAFTRAVIPLGDWAKRFKVYVPHVYDPFLAGSRFPYTFLDWTLPDLETVHYERISSGTGYTDAVYEAKSSDEIFAGSRINWNGFGWDLSLENGTTFLSPEAYDATRPQQGSLVGIFDKEGHEIRLTRESNGDLAKVESASGRWIKFAYRKGRMIEARDSSRNVAEYIYDAEARLASVVYSEGSAIKYSYDSANRVVRLEDSSSGTMLENKYSPTGSIEQIKVGGKTYGIRHLVDDVDITDPTGAVTRVHIMATDRNMTYTVENVVRDGRSLP
jgi:YD repeat-containing protein